MTILANAARRLYGEAFGLVIDRPPPRKPDVPANAAIDETPRALRDADGTELELRSIRPDDFKALQRGFRNLTPDEVRMRFLHPLTDLVEPVARSLCDLDPKTGVAFVLADPPQTAEPEIHAVARAYIDPATLAAEFAVIVQRRFAGKGYGRMLMDRLLRACRDRGAVEMWGDVFLDNVAMLALAERLGFEKHWQPHDPGVVRINLDLTKTNPAGR
jgi:GNAT superfamily N-acetyltransferase